ncbi:MAG: hypothetical protein ACYT04_36680 [Nostoc sp.]
MPQIQRWYKGFSYRGNPQELVKQISEQVQRHNLGKFVPLLRVEKGAKSRKQFYFFLAVESLQEGEIPTEVQSTLLKLSFFTSAIKGSPSLTYEQIKPMVGVAHDVYEYTNNIPYQPVQELTCDNPFDLIESISINNSLIDIDMSRRYEQLLYWLSALGSGTWESFKKACAALKIEEPRRILRRLRLLGHIEFSPDGYRWSIARIAIVKIISESNLQEFILCGSRSINLLEKLTHQTTLELINQPRGEAPPCVRIQADNPSIIPNLVEELSKEFSIINAGEVSKLLASILPELITWKQSLRNLQGIVPSLYEWELFDGNDFVSCTLPRETGMYRMYNTKISDRPLHTLFYENGCWFQGDWYGLRFLALQHRGQQCIARYEVETKRLAIPVSQRLPEIYERALVLASGILPKYSNSWLLYENVERDVMLQICYKLHINCGGESTHV